MPTDASRRTLRFGIKTTPMHLTYGEILRTWEEADELPEIGDAWLWDHLMPLAGPPDGAALEGWTLLAALAARTTRLRLGLLVTSNRLRAPAHLGKIATTVDVISRGRLIMGLGVGGTRQPEGPNPAVAEYAAYGFPLPSPGEGLARLTETITILRRMWNEAVFDHAGPFTTLRGTRNRPGPVRPGGPPLLLGGWGDRTLRIVAEHADIWNVPGPPHNTTDWIAARSRVLDAHCAAIGRDPTEITRSAQIIVDYADPAGTRAHVHALAGAGIQHVVLALPRPYPPKAARWLVDEIVIPVRESGA
ncbi:LLM class flavin-dependent oxidoreductase [Streptomyces sp. NBC_00820]|uniref:LLM class flavin-dependent oxidoreductase n=1 Tax=Streptomyces sp. NBC_00820 TaxID=2975842 RepID=UPI002ED64154|nr:LLM class flavin-dependent oxidoreductase [Streptomyces sp. NBC_00820]